MYYIAQPDVALAIRAHHDKMGNCVSGAVAGGGLDIEAPKKVMSSEDEDRARRKEKFIKRTRLMAEANRLHFELCMAQLKANNINEATADRHEQEFVDARAEAAGKVKEAELAYKRAYVAAQLA